MCPGGVVLLAAGARAEADAAVESKGVRWAACNWAPFYNLTRSRCSTPLAGKGTLRLGAGVHASLFVVGG